jgi:aminopeptidase N
VRDFVEVVLRGLAAETDDTAVKQLPIYVQVALDQFVPEDDRAELRVRWEHGVRALVEQAAPGSDKQLTFVRSLSGTAGKRIPPCSYGGAARTDEGLDLVEGLLDGTTQLDGLTVGADLRWNLLTALAARGRADRERVLAELADDNTISGKERAAAALAVIPSTETKAEAWENGAVRDGVPNETQRSIAYVFDTSEQQDVLAPYLEKYLEVAETIWEEKGTQIASTMLEYMFPRSLTSQETLDRVDAWLASSSANPAAKRYVLECRDDLVRALEAQAFNAR